jgi:RNA polymerase sigma-70 factor (ECF subfamily)
VPNLNELPPFSRDEALQLARSGQAEAIGELLESYRTYLRMLATTQLRGKIPARVSPSDVVQETMLAAHRAFGDFRGESSAEFSAWLRKIMSHKLLSMIDRHLNLKRDVRREVSMNVAHDNADSSNAHTLESLLTAADPSPSTIVSRSEDNQRLAELLLLLPEHYRLVITLRNQQGLRFEEISRQLDRTPLAARLLWLRAIQRLRDLYLQREAGDA